MSNETISEENVNISNAPESKANEFVQGFSLSGEYVKGLSNKRFKVVGHRQQTMPDLAVPGQTKVKTILTVVLENSGETLDYIPNKTSMKVIIGKKGYRLSDWVGFEGEFFVTQSMVGTAMKDVIYIKGV